MKTIVIFVILFFGILFVKTGHTQDTLSDGSSLKYFNLTGVGFSFGLGHFNTNIINGRQLSVKNDEMVFLFQTINGFKYMNKIGIGVSVGAEVWQNGLFWPICGYLSYDLKPADNTFFANIYMGSSIGKRKAIPHLYQESTGAFAFSIGLGYKMKLSKKLRFMYEVFYKYQALQSSYDIGNDSVAITRKVDYKVPLNFAGFRLGICFP